jgi:transposase-like protein
VHRARNLYAKLPERERERVKHAYRQSLDDAISHSDAKQKLQALVDELDKAGYTATARCLAGDLDALVVHLRYPPRHRADGGAQTCSSARSARSNAAPR